MTGYAVFKPDELNGAQVGAYTVLSMLTKIMLAFLAVAVCLALGILAGCQGSNPNGEGGPELAGESQDSRPMLQVHELPAAALFQEPREVQDLVNRSRAIVIGSVSAISGLKRELPYGAEEGDFQGEMYQGYDPRIEVTYYDIAIEEVLLDDGNVREHPRLRLDGAHHSGQPQMGERFLFTLGRNPDFLSYGIAADWMALPLDGGEIRNIDGTSPGYAGVTDEASLVAAIKDAVPNHDFLPVHQWPSRFRANEGDDAATAPPPGGPGGGDAGPAGNAND